MVTLCLRLSRTCLFFEVEVCEVLKSGPERQSIWSVVAELWEGRVLPILCPKPTYMSQRYCTNQSWVVTPCSFSEVVEVSKSGPDSYLERRG